LNASQEPGQISRVHIPLLFAYLLNWILVYMCLKNGMIFTTKIAFFTVFLPILMILVLFFVILFFPGAPDGILTFLKPDWEQLKHLSIWIAAGQQALLQFSIGLGFGLTLARFRAPKKKIRYQAVYIH
jgi:SNF family Na+-dependent transporter